MANGSKFQRLSACTVAVIVVVPSCCVQGEQGTEAVWPDLIMQLLVHVDAQPSCLLLLGKPEGQNMRFKSNFCL